MNSQNGLEALTYAWLSIQNHLQVILAWDLKIDFQMFFVGVICDALDKKDMQMRFKSCCWGLEWSIKPTEAMKCHEISPNALFWGQCQAQAENSVATHFSSPLSSHKQAARLKWKCLVSGQPSHRFPDGKPRMTSSTVLRPSRVIGLLDWLWIAVNGALSSLTFFAPGFSSGTNGPASTTTSSACQARHFNQSKWH